MALEWTWLCVPYLVCAAALAAVGLVAVLVRGDRVLRLGSVGAATTALPWALCSAVVTCTSDPELATRLLRLGNAPVALVGPSLLLVMLGVSGQLENHRWLARLAGAVGVVLMALCWATDLVVPGVHPTAVGVLYVDPGPLTGLHFAQIGIWLAIGISIARRATADGPERRRMLHALLAVLALGTIGATDMLIVYGVTDWFPIAWLPATLAALIALYYELRSELLRPQGFDRALFAELIGFAAAIAATAALAFAAEGATPLAIAAAAAVLWVIALGVCWTRTRARPVRVAHERALEQLIVALAEVEDDARIAARLTELWREVGTEVRRVYRTPATLDADVAAWLVEHGGLLAAADLRTMRVGPIRPRVEALIAASGANLIVPLVDRDALVGLVEADHGDALREDERGLVIESARAAARALTYVSLAEAASREGAMAREVELAEAMRLQASASRGDELGAWSVAAEYRTAARTTGAGWTASLLPDGRLAVLVTEAQAHGVAAALATAALTGAFVAAVTAPARLGLEDLLAHLRASADGAIRGGEPVAAFVAILDADARTVAWASAGHPGGAVLGPRSLVLGGGAAGLGASLVAATRGEAPFAPDAQLVVASTAVRDPDEARWRAALHDQAPAGPHLARALVESAARRGTPDEDLLAVVVRRRAA